MNFLTALTLTCLAVVPPAIMASENLTPAPKATAPLPVDQDRFEQPPILVESIEANVDEPRVVSDNPWFGGDAGFVEKMKKYFDNYRSEFFH